MDKTTLGNRMKGCEAISKNFLARKTPVIIRVRSIYDFYFKVLI